MNLNPYLVQNKTVVVVILETAKQMLYFEKLMHTHSEYTTELADYLENVENIGCRSFYLTYESNVGKIIAKVHCYMDSGVAEAIVKWLSDDNLFYGITQTINYKDLFE